MPIGWAIAGSALIGAVGSGVAASTEAGAQEQAAATQQGMFNTIVGQEQPFLQAGYGATTDLNQLLGTAPATGKGGTAGSTGLPGGYLTEQFNPTQAQLNSYPGYQFQLQTGGQALTNSMTPGVGAVSGPALKSLMSFNQGTAASNYSNYFNQFQTQQNNIFSRLSAIAGLGQNAAGNLGNAGTQLGTGIAQAQAAAGASIAGGIVGASNSLSSVPLAYLLANGSGLGGASTSVSYDPSAALSQWNTENEPVVGGT
jgi:hypothetical protein